MHKKLYFLLFIVLLILFSASCGSGNHEPAAGSADSPDLEDSLDSPENPGENPVTENTPATTEAPNTIEQTKKPNLIDRTFLAKDRFCVAGRGEEGATIRVEGGLSPVTAKVIDGQFIFEVFVDRSDDVVLDIYATVEGKEESEPLTVKSSGEKRSDRPVYVGKNNHLHYNETVADFLGNSLFSNDELKTIRERAENLQRMLAEAGLKTQVIFFVSPSHNTIYPETMPDFLADQKVSDNSRLKQLTETFKDSTVKFINPYDRLMKEKEKYFLYNRTDTHWNELGAYYGYCEIFSYIAQTFPNAKPLALYNFEVYSPTVRGGDLIPMLEFDQGAYNEKAPVVRIKEPTVKELFRGNTDEIAYQEGVYHQYHEYVSNDTSKPTILMYRDSFSISLMSPIAESSNRVIFYNMWHYDIDINYVKEINPDFLIIQRVERSLNDTISLFWKFK